MNWALLLHMPWTEEDSTMGVVLPHVKTVFPSGFNPDTCLWNMMRFSEQQDFNSQSVYKEIDTEAGFEKDGFSPPATYISTELRLLLGNVEMLELSLDVGLCKLFMLTWVKR